MLLGACVLVFLVAESSGRTTDLRVLLRFGASERSRIWRGEYWRFVTPMFLHIGWLHLLMNTYVIGSWSIPVEREIGSGRFVLAYLLCGVFATAVSVLFHDGVSAGASGAGFGVIGITIAIRYYHLGSVRAFVGNRGVRSLLFWIALMIALGVSGTLPLDNFTHVGGLAAGAVIGVIVTQSTRWDRAYRRMAWAMVATVVGFAVAAASRRWPGQRSAVGANDAMITALEAAEQGDLPRALARMDLALRYKEDDPAVWANRGALHDALGDHQAAADDYRRALSLGPADWPARVKVVKALASAEETIAPTEPSKPSSPAR